MTLFECFEKRKDGLCVRLKSAANVADAQLIMQEVFDVVLYEYINECKNDETKTLAAYMGNAVKSAFPLIEGVNETQVWERKKNLPAAAGKKASSGGRNVLGAVCLVAALALEVLLVIMIMRTASVGFEAIKSYVYTGAAGLVLAFVSGLLMKKKQAVKQETEHYAEVKVNADDIVRRMTAIVLVMDKNLTAIEMGQKQAAGDLTNEVIAPELAQLMHDLLEGKYSKNGEFALEQLEEVEHYLYSKGIKLYDYTPERRNWFEFLPTVEGENETIVPAMVCEDRLVLKGLATRKED